MHIPLRNYGSLLYPVSRNVWIWVKVGAPVSYCVSFFFPSSPFLLLTHSLRSTCRGCCCLCSLSVCLSVCLPVCLSVCLSVLSLFIYLIICPFVIYAFVSHIIREDVNRVLQVYFLPHLATMPVRQRKDGRKEGRTEKGKKERNLFQIPFHLPIPNKLCFLYPWPCRRSKDVKHRQSTNQPPPLLLQVLTSLSLTMNCLEGLLINV